MFSLHPVPWLGREHQRPGKSHNLVEVLGGDTERRGAGPEGRGLDGKEAGARAPSPSLSPPAAVAMRRSPSSHFPAALI